MSGYTDRAPDGTYLREDGWPAEASPYRLWVNADSTVFVRMWTNGNVEVATRADRSEVWGPPITLVEEDV